jgi:hypothetical protein
MNDALLGSAQLLRRVQVDQPVVVILTSDDYTIYGPIVPLLEHTYTEVQESANGQLWIRSNVASKVLPVRALRTGSKQKS